MATIPQIMRPKFDLIKKKGVELTPDQIAERATYQALLDAFPTVFIWSTDQTAVNSAVKMFAELDWSETGKPPKKINAKGRYMQWIGRSDTHHVRVVHTSTNELSIQLITSNKADAMLFKLTFS